MSDLTTTQLSAISGLDEDDLLMVVEDGTAKKVTVQQLRAALGMQLITTFLDSTETTYSANNTWEDVRGTSYTLAALAGATYVYALFGAWRPATANWNIHKIRCLVDGVTTGVTPTEIYVASEDANAGTASADTQTFFTLFWLSGLSAGNRALKIQTNDDNSSLDRKFNYTFSWILRVA